MASPSDPKRAPQERPVIDIARNIREWNDEVNGRIRKMVAWSLRVDRPVADHHLRKLGPDGRAAFGRALNRALDRKLRETAAAAAPAAEPDRLAPPEVPGPVLLPEVDWAERRRPRASAATRTWRWGGVVAALLVAVAAAWLRQQVYR